MKREEERKLDEEKENKRVIKEVRKGVSGREEEEEETTKE